VALSKEELKINRMKLQKAGKLKRFEYDGDTLIKYNGRESDLILPNCFSEIADGAFEGNFYLRNVTIPESYVMIGAKAFYKCRCLKTVEFGDRVYSIGDSAFAYCSLWHLVIPKNVANVGKLSFSDNEQLRIIEIEGDRVWFDRETFRGCIGVEYMVLPKNLPIGEVGLNLDKIEIQYK